MHLPSLRSWLICRGGPALGVALAQKAILPGWRLRTNYFSASRWAGAVNIEPAPNCQVEGVLMRVTPAVRDLLRRKEGWPRCYEEVEVPVTIPSSGRTITALTYVVVTDHQLPFDLPVTQDYRQDILDAATEFRFSSGYRRYLCDLLVVAPHSVSVPAAS